MKKTIILSIATYALISSTNTSSMMVKKIGRTSKLSRTCTTKQLPQGNLFNTQYTQQPPTLSTSYVMLHMIAMQKRNNSIVNDFMEQNQQMETQMNLIEQQQDALHDFEQQTIAELISPTLNIEYISFLEKKLQKSFQENNKR